jgi:hypothetical protein
MHDDTKQTPPRGSPLDDDRLFEIFKDEVWKQCRFVMRAIDDLNAVFEIQWRGPDEVERAFAALQSYLIAVANLSKLLWGTTKAKERERKRLRDALAVPDDSPLRDRKLRNHFEHFDERLEEWRTRDVHGNIVDFNLGPVPPPFGNLNPQSFLRHYDNTRGVALFWDEEYPLQPVVHAVVELAGHAGPPARDVTPPGRP